MKSLERHRVKDDLNTFLESYPVPGLVFVRGRRRIGKTWVLDKLSDDLSIGCFKIRCQSHRRTSTLIQKVLREWLAFNKSSSLRSIKKELIGWEEIFKEIGSFSIQHFDENRKPFVLIIDEIQWLSTNYEDSAGMIKVAWDIWASNSRLKVILCGSSQKFFEENVGAERPIRGLTTFADIEVRPFPLSVIRAEVTNEWSLSDTVLAYMCLGGIPYYWSLINPKVGMRRAINDAFFTRHTVFLEEWKQIIETEFRTDSIETLSGLFPAMLGTEEGCTAVEISQKSHIPEPTVHKLLEKLAAYGYIECFFTEDEGSNSAKENLKKEVAKQTKPRGNKRGTRFMITDFYLTFYFNVLRGYESKIITNDSELLFPYEVLRGGNSDYIESFTGKAFERLIAYHVGPALKFSEHNAKIGKPTLWKKLDLSDANYEVRHNVLVRKNNSQKIISQIDVLIVHKAERSLRVIECKWKSDGSKKHADETLSKTVPVGYEGFTRRNYLAVSYEPSKELLKYADEKGVIIIRLEDLI